MHPATKPPDDTKQRHSIYVFLNLFILILSFLDFKFSARTNCPIIKSDNAGQINHGVGGVGFPCRVTGREVKEVFAHSPSFLGSQRR